MKVNNLRQGNNMLEPCNCGLYDDHGQIIPQNVFEASLQRAQQGRKPDQKCTCLVCNHTWLDYKDNYATICKCGSRKIIGEPYHPEIQLKKILETGFKPTFMPSAQNGHGPQKNLLQASQPQPQQEPSETSKKKKVRDLKRVLDLQK